MIQILHIDPARSGAGNTRAFFDAELPNGVKLYRLRLVQSGNGYRVYGPRDGIGATVTLPLDLADQLAILARFRLEAVAHHATH